MRGLAFPTNAVYDREASYDRDYGTPRSNNADAIPIDPALSGNAVDPSMTGEGSGRTEEIVSNLTERAWFDARNASCYARAYEPSRALRSDYLIT